jgi:DNA-directed RNA polymerase specialized sigma subunit
MTVQQDKLERSLATAIEQLNATTDPTKRALACKSVHTALADAVKQVAQLSRDSVAQMHTSGLTKKEIAQLLNVSQHRLYLMQRRSQPGNGTAAPAAPAARATKAASVKKVAAVK